MARAVITNGGRGRRMNKLMQAEKTPTPTSRARCLPLNLVVLPASHVVFMWPAD
jgi:hypothetical protein